MNFKSRKVVFLLLVVFMIMSLVVGCSNDSTPSSSEGGKDQSGEKSIGISLPTKELARCLKDEEYLTDNLESMGYEVMVLYAEGKAQQQADQIENMILNGVSALIISPIDGDSLTQVVEMAHDNDIPVLAYDALIMKTEYIDYYVTDDLEEIGRLQARYIVDKLGINNGETGPFNLEIFAGEQPDNNAHFFYSGAMEILQPEIDKGTIVVPSGQIDFQVTSTPEWDGLKAQQRMDTILSAYYSDKTVDAVLTQNDGLALGVISALKSAGYGSDDKPYPIITGQDCDIASIKSIIAGEQTMTVFKDIRIMAERAAYVVDCMVKGEEPDMSGGTTFNNGVKDIKTLCVPPKTIDKSNYKELLFDSGYYSEDLLK